MSAPEKTTVAEWADQTGVVQRSAPECAPVSGRPDGDEFSGDRSDVATKSGVNLVDLDLQTTREAEIACFREERDVEVRGETTEPSRALDVEAFRLDEPDLWERDEAASRVRKIWREWLNALASDSEAAIATAMAYRQFSEDVRDEWVTALEADVDGADVSRVAVFAPLLAVETDPARRFRIAQLLSPGLEDVPAAGSESYARGTLAGGAVVARIVCPLYLDFVQVLACCYVPGERFLWVRHDPIAHKDQCRASQASFTGVQLETTPRHVLVDELAQTVVAVHRRGEILPEPLCLFAHLFTPGY